MTSRLTLAILAAIALPAAAQPRLDNATLTPRAVSGSLETTIRQIAAGATGPLWIAWAAPIHDPRSTMCCFSGGWQEGTRTAGSCRLEPGSGTTLMSRASADATRLELADTFFVFLRLRDRQAERVRMFSEDCRIDADGQTVTWLTDVTPDDSIAALAALAGDEKASRRAVTGALSALAQHGTPDAVRPLLALARQAPDAKVRGDALFWLSQRAGRQATDAIAAAVDDDPETEVKKRAVFALSQLPADEGVPKLIAVARSNRNAAVRRQAMFWLGQSKDARAIAFFEEILK